jgi:hypothetical protein
VERLDKVDVALSPAVEPQGQRSVGRRYASRSRGGTIHDFVLLNPISETPAVRAAVSQAADFLLTALAT